MNDASKDDCWVVTDNCLDFMEFGVWMLSKGWNMDEKHYKIRPIKI